jgi:hypothetical protein
MAQTLTTSQDAYYIPGNATTYGKAVTITVGVASSVGLVQFDLSGLPAGVTASQVAKANLTLYAISVSSPGTINVNTALGSWAETTVSGTAGSPALGGIVASAIPVSTPGTYITVDVTSAVQSWINNPASNNGLMITANGATVAQFDAKESVTTSHPATLGIVLTYPGAQGPAGAQGAQGPVGPAGATGAAGPAGAAGATGSQGPIGNTGPAGAAGATGSQGPIGATGPAGAAGATGSQGPIGNTGPAGAAGATGSQGPIGATGPAGAAGATGSQGPAGTNGTNGSIGPTGPAGPLTNVFPARTTLIPAGSTTTILDTDINTIFFVDSTVGAHATITLPHCNNSGTRYDGKKLSFVVQNIWRNTENGGNGFGPTIQVQGTTDKISDFGGTLQNGTVTYSTSLAIGSGTSFFAMVCFAGTIETHPGVWFQVAF